MRLRYLPDFASVLLLALSTSHILGQTPTHTTPAATPNATSSPTQPGASAAAHPDCNGPGCEDQQPLRVISVSPPPASWLLRDRIAFGATLALAAAGWIGIFGALSLLRKIERSTIAQEIAATAAQDTAQALLLNAQAQAQAERPWVLVNVEHSPAQENSFQIVAANRGRSPARITALPEETRFVIDEDRLPATPEYKREKATTPFVPIILLPGESTVIKTFRRDQVQSLCESPERFKRIEGWEDKLFFYGRVLYRDLVAPAETEPNETNWCCWYIHGRQKSAMVMAGPAEYNAHS
jgi:hypothetical protein